LAIINKKCQDNNIRPIFLTLPPVNPERIQRVFNETTAPNWKTEAAKVNAYIRKLPDYVDIYPSLVDDQGLLPVKYSQDGLHLDISGKKIIGQKVADYIKEHSL
jgi:lysophospholipase L1-like esterase